MNTVTLDDNSEAQTTGDLQDSRILTEILWQKTGDRCDKSAHYTHKMYTKSMASTEKYRQSSTTARLGTIAYHLTSSSPSHSALTEFSFIHSSNFLSPS